VAAKATPWSWRPSEQVSAIRPQGVLFDAGGTLVRIHADRLAAALRVRGANPHNLGDAFWRMLVRLEDDFSPSVGEFWDWWPRWLANLANCCGVPARVMAEAFREADQVQNLWDDPLPGAAECLLQLREAGIRLGVVSNADGRIAETLDRAGLAELLDVIVDSTVVGVYKPDPAIFDHALKPLGLEAAETWYLGDTVAYDAVAADAAGLMSWIIDHAGLHTVDHPRRVRSLAEFTGIVLTGF
jgi:HAD superfamily hydrolase (TIGR01509 family)